MRLADEAVGAVAEGLEGGPAAAAEGDRTALGRHGFAVFVEEFEVAPHQKRTVRIGANLN